MQPNKRNYNDPFDPKDGDGSDRGKDKEPNKQTLTLKLVRKNSSEMPPKPPPRLSLNKTKPPYIYDEPFSAPVTASSPQFAQAVRDGFGDVASDPDCRYEHMQPVTLANLAKKDCTQIPMNEAALHGSVYQVPLKQLKAPHGCQRYQVNLPNLKVVKESEEKVVVLLGSDGAGKSTLINAAFNYAIGVQWSDEMRFRVINSGPTRMLTSYSIPQYCGSRLNCTLTLVDTPNISDSDAKVDQQLRAFVGSELAVAQVQLLCLVAQSGTMRITAEQKSAFLAVLALFEQDVHQNVLPVATFADSAAPCFFQALRDASVSHRSDCVKINNAALFAANCDENAMLNRFLWDAMQSSFKELFSLLQDAAPCKLRQAKAKQADNSKTIPNRQHKQTSNEQNSQVGEDRKLLDDTLATLVPQVRFCANRVQQLRKEKECFEAARKAVYNVRDQLQSVSVAEVRKVNLTAGHYVTNCLVCNMTCHDDCCYANDSDKHKCSVMTVEANPFDARCTVCPAHCSWREHINQPFFFQWQTQSKTLQELTDMYEAAQKTRLSKEQIVAQLDREQKQAHRKLYETLVEARKIIIRLNQSGQSEPLSLMKYLNLLIKAEQQEMKPGYEDRVKALEDVKIEIELIRDVTNNENVEETIDVVLRGDENHQDFQKLQRFSDLTKSAFLGTI